MTTILYILVGIVGLILILAFLAPKSYHVNRRIRINRPSDTIFNYIKYLKNQDHWSPWGSKDPDMTKEFNGVDGTVGAVSSWKGNKEVGEGEQEITNIREGEMLETQLRFYKPFRSTSDAYIRVRPLDSSSSEVIWGFSGSNRFPMSIMMLFMNMDKAVGKDFESGLNRLKKILEDDTRE
ncbi:SRPBCC family protein [Robertkochia aurantiaca]|uniref:SRPBCC family protein n=1 Tax=Robertkochia aurantiaca TaxID=2873700 RepID=UPI001CCE4998|nr:SRPBCC family protein [Robertkochia sp. 3YJGBD-33]